MVFTDEDNVIIKFPWKNKKVNLQFSEKFVASNESDGTINAFHCVMPTYFIQMKHERSIFHNAQ